MAASSKSPSTPVQAHNSRQSRRPPAARDVHSPPYHSLLETDDQEQSVASSYSIPHSEIVDAFNSLAVYESAAGVDDQVESSENGSAAKKAVWKLWNKPSNALAAVDAEVGAVMGAESWPALSDTARGSPKSSLVLSNGSIIIPEGVLPDYLSPRKELYTSISTPNHVASGGQRSTQSGDDSLSHNIMAANGSLCQAPMLGAFAEPQQQNAGNSVTSAWEYNKEEGPWGYVERGRSFGGNEMHSQHGPYRGNSGPQARPDGSYHHRHGGRRDPHRREGFASHKRDGSRPFVRGPALNRPFISPPSPPVVMRPFVNPMVYHEMPQVFFVPGPHLDSPRPMHMVSYSPMLFPMPDPHLLNKILNQINYYFSNENLVKDTFLRRNMDREGWVSVKLIAGFKKVMQLTDNIHLILDAIQASNVVEVQGDKVRRRHDWIKWLMPLTQYSTATSPSIHDSGQDNLAAHINSVSLREKAAN